MFRIGCIPAGGLEQTSMWFLKGLKTNLNHSTYGPLTLFQTDYNDDKLHTSL
jgi:hypothetical protein